MANRFLDTNFFKSPFVRSLEGSLKLLYGYIICDCDGAGIWNLDLEVANVYIGFRVSDDDFDEKFVKNGKAIPIGGGKYFFPDFIEHQYPSGLQANNKAHRNFINTLKKYCLIDENLKVISKPLQSPLKGGQGNGNCNGNGNSQGQGNGEPPKNDEALVPKMQALWYKTIPTYTKDYTKDYPAIVSIFNFIKTQANLGCITDEETQEKVLNTFQLIADEANVDDFWRNKPLKSIENNIQEFYNRIKDKKNGQSRKTKSAGTAKPSLDDVSEAHARRYANRQ